MDNILNSSYICKRLLGLLTWIDAEEYKGYDPYDTLNSPLFSYITLNPIKYIFLQCNKYFPWNIRPLIGIKKNISPKGMAIFLNAYSKLLRIDMPLPVQDIINKGLKLQLSWIRENKIELEDTICWAINFSIASVNSERQKNDPSSVLACFMGEALYEYYLNTKENDILNLLVGIANFLNTKIPITETNDGICYSYTQYKKDIVFNANMHVAEFFSKLFHLTSNEEYRNIAKKCVNFTIKNQKSDGRWVYSISEGGEQRHQYDFHQGFILSSLYDYIVLCNDYRKDIIESLKKGYNFYKSCLFFNGQSFWRYPKRYPTDIHNQAMGIICFSKLSNIFDDAMEYANKILSWTLANMQDNSGYFYTHYYPHLTNKIPYIRWGQAWMCLAFAELLTSLKGKGTI